MALRRLYGSSAPALLGICLLLGTGCVDPFSGSNIQFTLAGSVHIPGTPSDFGRPPPGTHYEFYALDIADDGREFAFKVTQFDVRPAIEQASPCFIEDDESRYPGLHATKFVDRLAVEFGFDRADFDPASPPSGMSDGDVIDYLTAEVRENNLGRIQGSIKAVTSHSPARYADEDWLETGVDCPVGDECDGAGGERCNDGMSCERPVCAGDAMRTASKIPPAYCLDDASANERTDMCEEFWAANPNRYEGSDKVFTLPLNGKWVGAVDGADPRNNQFLGGAGMFVDANLEEIEGLLMNFQYNCTAADFNANPDTCAPDYPAAFTAADESAIGYHYMSGLVQNKTRGVINVPMNHRTFTTISGEAAIWFNLDDDDVQF